MTALEAAADAAPAGVAAPAPATAARFTGDARTFWRIQLRGALRLALTLGLYRFWLATDVRRFLWSHTEAGEDGLEYTGTALELLIGFMIAIAILLPLYVFAFVATLGMGSVGQAVSTLGIPLLAFLGQFAYFRARRYRLTRTVFRGIRFHQSGSALRYAACAMTWWLLMVLTLGLVYPFMQAQLERYKMRHTHYGDVSGRFDGSGFRLLLRGLPMWLLVVAPVLLALAAFASIDWPVLADISARGAGEVLLQAESLHPGFIDTMVTAVLSLVLAVALALLLLPAFQAMMLRWWTSGLRMGPAAVRARLPTLRIYGAYVRFLLLALAFLAAVATAAFAAVAVFLAVVGDMPNSQADEIVGVLGLVAVYVATMLGLAAIYQSTVRLALWRHTADTAEIDGLALLDRVGAAGIPSSAIGEGLADALSMGGL